MSRYVLSLFVVGCCLVVGCADPGPPTKYVSGSVTLDGEPLEDAFVEFQPGDGSRGTTLMIAAGEFSGDVLVGNMTVRFFAMRPAKPDPRLSPLEMQNPRKNILPDRYGFDSTTQLDLTTEEGTGLSYQLDSK